MTSYNQIIFLGYLALIVLMSFVTLIAFIRDKNLAIKGKDRTKEKTLLFLSIFFGSFGAFFGRIIAHHKTDKIYFSMVIYLSVILEALVAFLLGYLAFIA